MRRLPAEIIEILESAPRRCPRRAHVMGLVQWRLQRGLSFTAQELVKAAKFRTTKRFVESNLDALILQGVIVQLPDKSYAACERNEAGCIAALRRFAEEKKIFTRREAWIGMTASLSENGLDRLLRRMVKDGVIKKAGRGRYALASVDIKPEPAATPKPERLKPERRRKVVAPDLRPVSKAA